MEIKKLTGYILLALGLIIIGITLYQSYNIFSGGSEAPIVFKEQGQVAAGNIPATDTQKQIDNAVGQQISKMIPIGAVSKVLNLLSWSLFAGILIIAGGVISGIGVKLVK